MNRLKYLILGAGPAGLTFARKLKDVGEKNFLVLEKEDVAGGLCRTKYICDGPVDIGGGHFLDTKIEDVCNFLFEFLPQKEWNRFERVSTIKIHDTEIDYPIESNIWQFSSELSYKYLESIRNAGCNNDQSKPEQFSEWIRWKLGDEIADNYMIPYNGKLYGNKLSLIGTSWLYKLPNVSYEEILKSYRERRSICNKPAHASFYYPKNYGYGEVFLRIADSLEGKIWYRAEVSEMDINNRTVKLSNGEKFYADVIISTIPWKSFILCNAPSDILLKIQNLQNNSIEVRYMECDPEKRAHWTYVPDEKIPYHRVIHTQNFSKAINGCFVETEKSRTAFYPEAVINETFAYVNDYAYPLNTIGLDDCVSAIREETEKNNIYALGRWGEHKHLNSDVVIYNALKLAKMLCVCD